ncbi:MAG: aminopeptidase P family protein [Candidatus Bathyarchaeota archaeon]|nr:aminopeptidase P family protein [Candidatus Bathyarchaeota archaeon]
MNKTQALQQKIKDTDIENFAVFNPANITYFSQSQCPAALLISKSGEKTLYVYPVNQQQAAQENQDFQVEIMKRGENLLEKIAAQAATKKGKLAVDTMGIESWQALAKMVGENKIEVARGMIRELRAVKDEEEIGFIREACKMADEAVNLASQIIVPGASEQEIAAELEYTMRVMGSEGVGFDTIIGSGVHSALPHCPPCRDRIIQEGDFVVVDLGAIFKFYRSDITRTFIAGKPTQKQLKIYETVKLAQDNAFKALKPGALARDVDAIARKTIADAGFGEYFCHNLGHGVGLEVHEAPTLSTNSKDVLQTGMVVTDEPGIYLPELGGVRIEDTVLITKDGAEKLTNASYTLDGR